MSKLKTMKNYLIFIFLISVFLSCKTSNEIVFTQNDDNLINKHLNSLKTINKDSIVILNIKPIDNYTIARTFFEQSESEKMLKTYNEYNPDKKLKIDSLKLYLYKDKKEINNYLNQLNDNFRWDNEVIKSKKVFFGSINQAKPPSREDINILKKEIKRLEKLEEKDYTEDDYAIKSQLFISLGWTIRLYKPIYSIDNNYAIIYEIRGYSHGKLLRYIYKKVDGKWVKVP